MGSPLWRLLFATSAVVVGLLFIIHGGGRHEGGSNPQEPKTNFGWFEGASKLPYLHRKRSEASSLIRLALVRPFSPHDADDLVSSFDEWRAFFPCEHAAGDVDKPYEVDLYLSFSQTFESHPEVVELVTKAIEASQHSWGACFGAIRTLEAAIPSDEDKYSYSVNQKDPMWVNGPNTQFRRAVQDIRTQRQYDAMFLMESDSTPIKDLWLDRLALEIRSQQPFTILGSEYHGCTWKKAIRKRLPVALLRHINGNAVYNMSNPLFNLILDELESEAMTYYNALPYDYRISQIITESSKGILPDFPYKAMRDENGSPITLPVKTAKFRSWWQRYGGTDESAPVKESSIIENFALANFLPSQVGQHVAIVHGKRQRNPWNPLKHKISLVVSDVSEGFTENLVSKLGASTHPFAEVVLMTNHKPFTVTSSSKDDSNVPVTIINRDSPSYMDLCEAPVSSDWFLIMDSNFQVARDLNLLFTRDDVNKPVVPYSSADSGSYCMKNGGCRRIILKAQEFHQEADKAILDSDLLFHRSTRDLYCNEFKKYYGLKGEEPTATSFVAYLEALGVANELYSFSDRTVHGSFEHFVKQSEKDEILADNEKLTEAKLRLESQSSNKSFRTKGHFSSDRKLRNVVHADVTRRAQEYPGYPGAEKVSIKKKSEKFVRHLINQRTEMKAPKNTDKLKIEATGHSWSKGELRAIVDADSTRRAQQYPGYPGAKKTSTREKSEKFVRHLTVGQQTTIKAPKSRSTQNFDSEKFVRHIVDQSTDVKAPEKNKMSFKGVRGRSSIRGQLRAAVDADERRREQEYPGYPGVTRSTPTEKQSESNTRKKSSKYVRHLDADQASRPSVGNSMESLLADVTVSKTKPPAALPFFWHIPKAGGTSMKRLLVTCLNLLDASPRGRGHDSDETLSYVQLPKGGKTINVDLGTTTGIQRAKHLGLANSGLADVVISPLFQDSSSLFTPENNGVAFAVFRHPVERAVSMFHYLRKAYWEPTYEPALANITLEEYASSSFSEDNWIVRSLVGKLNGGTLSTEDLRVAKDVVGRKFLVGLTSDMTNSVRLFSKYFGWNMNEAKAACLKRVVRGGENKNAHTLVAQDSVAWRLLAEKNRFDLDLFDFVLHVYKKQQDWLGVNNNGGKLNRFKPFSSVEISKTARTWRQQPLRVLIFNGQENIFSTYNLENDLTVSSGRPCSRCLQIIPMLVDALRSFHPERFQRGMPPFQMVFSTTDSSNTNCINHPVRCDTASFAPWIEFGSVLKDLEVLPTARAFPNWFYISCLWSWRNGNTETCSLDKTEVRKEVSWSSLKPQLIWRGSDFHFLPVMDEFRDIQDRSYLHDPFQHVDEKQLSPSEVADRLLSEWDMLLPRWRGVALSIKAEAEYQAKRTEKWIDAKFVQQVRRRSTIPGRNFTEEYQELTKRGLQVSANEFMRPEEMAQYKYQVDFGGGGGTSWKGTLAKLAMPGLLFHHETPTKDWFYDELKPWIHYVPIQWDVTDLRAKYEWAEGHPEEAEKIAKAGTQFAQRVMSDTYMNALYKELFSHHIGRIVDAYRPAENETVPSILSLYENDGFKTYRVSTCDDSQCSTDVGRESPIPENLPRLSQIYWKAIETSLVPV